MAVILLLTFSLWAGVPACYADSLPAGYEPVSGNSSYEVSPDGTVGNLTAHHNLTIGNWNQGFNV